MSEIFSCGYEDSGVSKSTCVSSRSSNVVLAAVEEVVEVSCWGSKGLLDTSYVTLDVLPTALGEIWTPMLVMLVP